jgi:hypothetical protein
MNYECPQQRLAQELFPAVQAMIARISTDRCVKVSCVQPAPGFASFDILEGDQRAAKFMVSATSALKLREGLTLDIRDISFASALAKS